MWALVMLTYHLGNNGHPTVTSIAPVASEKVCMEYRSAALKNLVSQQAKEEAENDIVCYDLSKYPVVVGQEK